MDFTQLFLAGIKSINWFDEGLDIAKANSSGRMWLVGGAVYRSIANRLYGTPLPDKTDLDFAVESAAEEFKLPGGWELKTTRLGGPRFVNGKRQIDIIPLRMIPLVMYSGLEPTIENYLAGTSLNIQSIVYEVCDGKVIGEKGIDALIRKVVEANNLEFARYTSGLAGGTVETMIRRKAASLDFTPVSPAR